MTVKNIFRVRTPQAMEVMENSSPELGAPFIQGTNEAVMAEATAVAFDPMPEPNHQAPETHYPEPSSVEFDSEHHSAEESGQPVAQEMAPSAAPEAIHPDVPNVIHTVPPGQQQYATPVTDHNHTWLSQYVVPEMEAIQAEIQELRQFIQEMEYRKAELEKKVNERGSIRDALLTGTGSTLKQAVQHVFSEFGVAIQPSGSDSSHIMLEHKGLDFVSEIVGSEDPISLSDIRQLNHRVEDFIEVHGRQPKGLLIANPLTNLPLDERDGNSHVAFPDELRLLAEQRYKFSMVTGPQLFVAYCKFKEGQLDVNEFMNALFETVWVYGNHRDYSRFKVTPAQA